MPAETEKAQPSPEAPPPPSPPARRRYEDRSTRTRRLSTRKSRDNVVGAFLLAVIVGATIAWTEHARCPGALRSALLAAAPIALPAAVVLAGLLVGGDATATREQKVGRGLVFLGWASAASLTLLTGMLLLLNERGAHDDVERRCLVERR